MAVASEPTTTSPGQEPSTEAVADQIFSSALGAFDVLNIYLGDRLGWYRTLSAAGALTPDELATRTGTTERYVREWLEQQAASGLLIALGPAGAEEPRRFRLSGAAAEVLTDESS